MAQHTIPRPRPLGRCDYIMRGSHSRVFRGHGKKRYHYGTGRWRMPCPNPAVVIIDGTAYCRAHAPRKEKDG